MKRLVLSFILFIAAVPFTMSQADESVNFKTAYTQSFSTDKSTRDFEFSDASKWLISKEGRPGQALKCLGQGSYVNQFGGPSIMALLKGYEFEDFVLEMDVLNNGKDFSLLDFCVFFGVKSPNEYCYAQIANRADKTTHNVFSIQNDQPNRVGIKQNEGVVWGIGKWNAIRVERLASKKVLKVYFNEALVMESTEESFASGLVGFGSTNSAFKVDNLKISAPAYQKGDLIVFK